jgi:hypothetical protein
LAEKGIKSDGKRAEKGEKVKKSDGKKDEQYAFIRSIKISLMRRRN